MAMRAAKFKRLGLALSIWRQILALVILAGAASAGRAEESELVAAARAYRQGGQPVSATSETTIFCEAEEFQIGGGGWQAKPWGTNYYAATFANTFLSRKAYLGVPEQAQGATASIEVEVPRAGRYLALVRYEAAYRFETQFRLTIEQAGQTKLDRLYGARDNVKIWAFTQAGGGLKKEVAWDWGAVENMVWEGHDIYVDLQPGRARLTLMADAQPEPAARRNVDLVMLTADEAQVKMRLEKEGYLPLDGMLTQQGDVFLKVHNQAGSAALTLTVPNGQEHSPYWTHLRDWPPQTISAQPGESTEWIEVGSLLDTLNDGQWKLAAAGAGPLSYSLEFGVRDASGQTQSIKRFDGLAGDVELAYDADTRYSRRIRLTDEVLYDLVDYLKKQPVKGIAPKRTLVYAYTALRPKPGDARFNAAIEEFIRLTGVSAPLGIDAGGSTSNLGQPLSKQELVRGYVGIHGVKTDEIAAVAQKLKAEGAADKVAVVSRGDEIGLPAPAADDHAGFRAWAQGRGLKASDADPGAGDDWSKVFLSTTPETAKAKPALFYFSKLYGYHYGIQTQKAATEVIRKHLPRADVGANVSPHGRAAYLGDTALLVSLFRAGGMTMPWSEDYIWQLPVGSQQMNSLTLDLFRAGIRRRPEARIQFYVMPHTPGNTPDSWRRQFYGDLAHGMKVVNLFEFQPVQLAYTENHTSWPEMYQEVRRSLHELGTFEELVQDGQVRPGVAGLWFSETGDAWDDKRHPFAAAKRALYIAIRHQQLPLDVVVEQDALDGTLLSYQVLYLADAHVSRAASKAIADWVATGGRLFATAGAGMFDEFDGPNTVLRELLGVEPESLETPEAATVRFIKQDLPFSQPLDVVTWQGAGGKVELPVFAARGRFKTVNAEVRGVFRDGSPAIAARQTGKGQAVYCGFLPGLTYFKPAIPLRPVDRGATDEAMSHFIPREFHPEASELIGLPAAGVARPVVCSQPLVESTVIEAPQGVLIPLVNWSGKPVQGLTVTLAIGVPGQKATLAGGGTVAMKEEQGKCVFTLDLDVADALILR